MTYEKDRESIRQKELKKSPTAAIKDSIDRGISGSLVDLVGSLGWKGTGILIIVLIAGYIFLNYL